MGCAYTKVKKCVDKHAYLTYPDVIISKASDKDGLDDANDIEKLNGISSIKTSLATRSERPKRSTS